MAKYKQFYIDEDILHRARAALEELATLRRQQIANNGPVGDNDDHDGRILIRELENASRKIGYVIQDEGRQMSKDEELEAIDRTLAKLSAAAGYVSTGNRAEKLNRYAESVLLDRDRAYSTFATFANEMRVQVLALRFVAENMLHCGTHREKANVLSVLLDAMRAVEQSIVKVDGDPKMYDYFSEYQHNEGSWSFRDLLADKRHLEDKLRRVQDELLALQNKREIERGKGEIEPEPPNEDGLAF